VSAKIHLLARPAFDIDSFLVFLEGQGCDWRRSASATQAEEIVEIAGRVCYMSFGERQSPRDNSEYLRNLINSGHESVLEHVSWTFLIEGVSRAFTHQLVRHRPGWAYSQLSQQYHDEAGATFVRPEELRDHPEAYAEWSKAVEQCRAAYIRLMDILNLTDGHGKERSRSIRSVARSVLPNATETKIVVTANARALRHFLKVRGSIEGDSEMRIFSAELLKMLRAEAPSLFGDFSIQTLRDGTPTILHSDLASAQPPR
jgi:thymidylate synthase (FAD)